MEPVKRPSKAHFIVSSAYLGVSEDVAKLFANVAKYYEASVYHLGPTVSEKEMKRLSKLNDKITNANAMIELLSDSEKSEKKIESLENTIDDWQRAMETTLSQERIRIQTLVDHFGDMTFVLSPDQYTSQVARMAGVTAVDAGLELSRYMYLSAVEPSSERTVQKPVTTNSMSNLKFVGGKHSWVIGHPVPSIETMAKPGLNQAHKYYTVGSLQHINTPRHRKQFHQIAHMPCAILLLIDEKTGEYHAKQIYVDYVPMGFGKPNRPVVIDDGLVFFVDKIIEVGEEDRGTYSTDDHAPYQHAGTLGAMRHLNVVHRPSVLINGGDACDFASVCRHTLDQPGARENLRIENDLISLRNLLDAQANVPSIKQKVLIDSNHHEWVTQEVKRNPYLKGLLDWKTLARTRFPDWNILIREAGDNVIYKFGDYSIRHGDQESTLPAAERMNESGKYMCGHWHRYRVYRRAVTVGCGAGLGPAYIENKVTSWISQVTSLTKYKGIAAVNPKVVLHDERRKVSRFAYRRDIFEVDYHQLPKVA